MERISKPMATLKQQQETKEFDRLRPHWGVKMFAYKQETKKYDSINWKTKRKFASLFRL